MKNNNFFTFFGFAFVITISIIAYSCSKDQESNSLIAEQLEQSTSDVQLEKQILSFIEKIDNIRKNPIIKSGAEPMPIEEAIWNIEAAANLTYGDASYDRDEYIVSSSIIEIPLIDNQVEMVDVQTAYDEVIENLSAHNDAIEASEKQLIVADVALSETNDNIATLEITSGFGTMAAAGSSPCTNSYPWNWGWELGRCDGSGLGVGKDAADIIVGIANCNISVPGGNSYYTDVWYEEVLGCEYTNSNGDCLLFEDYQEYTLVHECLSTSDIIFYKNGLETIGILESPSQDHSVINYTLEDYTAFGEVPGGGGDCWTMVHRAEIKYGIWHTSTKPPDEI